MKNLLIKTSGNLKLFIIVIAIYLIFTVFNTQLILNSLNTFKSLVVSILPTLVIVFLLMFVSNLLLNEKKITKLLGSESGMKGYVLSVVFGILSAGPIYMWYPILADLREKGVKNSFIVIFLYNRAVKIPLLPMMIYYFGSLFVLVLTIYMIIFSIINGLIIDKLLITQKQ